MDPITTAASVAGAKAIELLLTDIYGRFKSFFGNGRDDWRASERCKAFRQQIDSLRQVKTLFELDRPVDLLKFYCPLHVLHGGADRNRGRREASTLDAVSSSGHVLIRGIAGQGKSMLLRKLCVHELESAERLPVFVELRRIQQDESLLTHIGWFLRSLDLQVTEESFVALWRDGKVVCFLDGLDEVPDVWRPRVVNEVERYASLGQQSRMVVASRRDAGLDGSHLFTNVDLDFLVSPEETELIRQLLFATPELADGLVDHLSGVSSSVQPLLSTPLLVTLLVIAYRAYQSVPATLAGFYDGILGTLLQRHDGLKSGFRRVRRCSLSDGEFRSGFDALCFEAHKIQKGLLTDRELEDLGRRALERCSLTCGAREFVDDIVNVTCLIVREGPSFRFIHRSVEEFYAASYIRTRSEAAGRRFYERVGAGMASDWWINVVRFLSEIDAYRYRKFFVLPRCLAWLDIEEHSLDTEPSETCGELALRVFGPIHYVFDEQWQVGFRSVGPFLDPIPELAEGEWAHTFLDIRPQTDPAVAARLRSELGEGYCAAAGRGASRLVSVTVGELLKLGAFVSELEDAADGLRFAVRQSAREAREYVEREEACDLSCGDVPSASESD